jgi:enolase
VSIAVARAAATDAGKSLWQTLTPAGVTPRTPVPHFNVVNGGMHAPNELDFQEFMLAPLGAPTMAEAVRAGAEIYAALRRNLATKGFATGLGDEGGFAPRSPPLRTCWQCWSPRSRKPAIAPAATASRSPWTPPSSEF